MQRDVVADRHLVFEDGGVRAVRDVDDSSVLHVRPRADAYVKNVAAHDRAEPDGRVLAYMDVADDLCALFYERGRVNLRAHAAERSNHICQTAWSEKLPA